MAPLVLINRTGQNMCYVNTAVQILFSITAFRDCFLPNNTEDFSLANHPICREICRLFLTSKEPVGLKTISAIQLRDLVADKSGLIYLKNGEQQDMEEFLKALINELEKEVQYRPIILEQVTKFWGREQIKRKFNTDSGRCETCGYFLQQGSPQGFLTLTIPVPAPPILGDPPVNIGSLLQSYTTLKTMNTTCGSCHIGPKTVLEQTFITDVPDLFLICLNRFALDQHRKTKTKVILDDPLIRQDGTTF